MLLTMLTAAAVAQAAPATAARPLAGLPNNTVTYYDIPGKDGAAIEKSLKKMLADPALKQTTQLYSWDVGADVLKRTEGTKCTVQKVTAKLTTTVHLPRLAAEASLDKKSVESWKSYVATLEEDAAANLWFINDRLPMVEQAVVGADCATMGTTLDAALATMKDQQNAFAAQRIATAPKKR